MADLTTDPLVHDDLDRESRRRTYPKDTIRLPGHEIDPDKLVLSYDRPSDMLLIFLDGRERRSVVIAGQDYGFALVDPATNELVGVQIEDFLARAVKAQPHLIDLLNYAELRGMTIDEVRQERQAALGYGGRFQAWAEHEVRSRRRPAGLRKQAAVRALLDDDRLGLPIQRSVGVA